jgi:pimeloyl-ACP methyl ester carboxylesterase
MSFLFKLKSYRLKVLLMLLTIISINAACLSQPAPSNKIIEPINKNAMNIHTETMNDTTVHHQYPIINGIRYHYAEAGKGPLVIMLHGFPELWYSWRHQLTALAKAGYHAVAPDLRGFGESQVTGKVSDYSLINHAKDVKALIDHLGAKEVVVIGHDWGANLMWIMPMLYPQTVKAVVAVSIPFYPAPRDPAKIKAFANGKFNFLDYFQQQGATEAEFNKDPARFFRLFFFGLSGDAPKGTIDTLYLHKPANAKLLDGFPEPTHLPAWLSKQELAYYVDAYKKTGITPALGFYRNIEHDYPELKEIYKKGITQPVLFIGGGEEAAVRFGSLEPMKAALPQLRKTIVIPNCGHWVQQERANEVNAAIIDFLRSEAK